MISMELSTVQHNTAKSAALEAAVSDYLAQGGRICTLQGFAYQPKPASEAKPYGRQGLGDRPKQPRKRNRKPKQVEHPTKLELLNRARAEKYELVRELAATMTITQIVNKVGLSNHRLRELAAEGGFEFQEPSPTAERKPRNINPIADAANVLRIKKLRDKGLARKQAAKAMGVSCTVVNRLVEDYAIDYPLQHPGRRR
jgi:transposase